MKFFFAKNCFVLSTTLRPFQTRKNQKFISDLHIELHYREFNSIAWDSMLCYAMQYYTIQHYTTLHYTIQHYTTQHNTTQYNTTIQCLAQKLIFH